MLDFVTVILVMLLLCCL